MKLIYSKVDERESTQECRIGRVANRVGVGSSSHSFFTTGQPSWGDDPARLARACRAFRIYYLYAGKCLHPLDVRGRSTSLKVPLRDPRKEHYNRIPVLDVLSSRLSTSCLVTACRSRDEDFEQKLETRARNVFPAYNFIISIGYM